MESGSLQPLGRYAGDDLLVPSVPDSKFLEIRIVERTRSMKSQDVKRVSTNPIDRFYQTWMGGQASAARWLTAFIHYYTTQRPNQALDDRTSAEEVMN